MEETEGEMTSTQRLTEIRDNMRDLAAMDEVGCPDVVMGLLLTVMALSGAVGGKAAHLACDITADAQTAWRKALAPSQSPVKDSTL